MDPDRVRGDSGGVVSCPQLLCHTREGGYPHGSNNWGQIPIVFDVQGAFGLLVCFWGGVLS